MSASRLAQIRLALERELQPLALEIIDDSAQHAGHPGALQGGHFRVRITCAAFRGRSQLERHRMVYAAVAPLMSHAVHALSITAQDPDEKP
ncbi:MAG TPA: BolA family protein [Steroidobacteraceae bacterium]